MTTIYVLTEGQYSDYHILAVFSTEERAKRAKDIADKFSGAWRDESKIEPYELDIGDTPDMRVPFKITFDGDQVEEDGIESFPRPEDAESWASPSMAVILVQATDIEHAVKIARDKRAQMLAEQDGIA